MNFRQALKIIGIIMLVMGALMIIPIAVALGYGEDDWVYFLYTMIPSMAIGLAFFLIPNKARNIHASDGFMIVAIGWIVVSAIAAVPLTISGYIPSFLNAMFETVSGFSTTGASAMPDVEILSYSMQFWRIFTNWIGGMGILVFIMAISPVAGKGTAIHLLRAESPGPETEKMSPKMGSNSRWLYGIYGGMTLAQIGALMIAGMDWYHATLVAFGTMATGGFAYLNTSMAALTMAQQTITTIFMVLAGINFGLFFLMLTGKFREAIKNEEMLTYLGIYVVSVALITLSIAGIGEFSSTGEAIHHAAFSVASVITTTGYTSCDMNVWPTFAKNLCLLLMFFGACAGSTAGGIKISRIGIAFKGIRTNLKKLMHPRTVGSTRYSGRELTESYVSSVVIYIVLFAVIYAVSVAIVCLDPIADFEAAFAAVDTTINNNGVGLYGAFGSFDRFQWYSRVVFIIDMLIGRLEIYPIMVLFSVILSPAKNGGRILIKKLSGAGRGE